MTDIATAAAAFRAAADLLDREGYTPYDDEIGLDFRGAAHAVAEAAGCFADEIEAAFAGWLLLTGCLAGTFDTNAGNLIARWETDRGLSPVREVRTGYQVTRELRAAADALSHAHLPAVPAAAADRSDADQGGPPYASEGITGMHWDNLGSSGSISGF